MALQYYRIERFNGLDQGLCENNIGAGDSPDACNMDTEGGRLSVAKGYVHQNETALADPAAAGRLFVWDKGGQKRFLAASDSGVSLLAENASAWTSLVRFAETGSAAFDFQNVKISGVEYLLTACGKENIYKWDGESAAMTAFGSAEALSDRPVSLTEIYYDRLFSAGDPEYPCRLYWSAAPGDTRTVEDWSVIASGENVSGGHVEVGGDSDPITALFALSNQLVILKRASLYRLLGDRPSNFRIYPLNAAMGRITRGACLRYGDALYLLTADGICCYDGQAVRRLSGAARVRTFLSGVSLDDVRSAACRDKLYFALREGGAAAFNAVLVYDLAHGVYMLRRGFTLQDMAVADGTLYLLDGSGYVCRAWEGGSYAGTAIEAYWNTPLTDMGSKIGEKTLRELYLRGSGGTLIVSAFSESGRLFRESLMPEGAEGILEVPLSGGGRAFSVRIENEGGSRFTVEGGLELLVDTQRRPL